MRRAIEYLTRLRDLSRKAAEAFDEDFPQQKSVYWRDFYAYDKAIDALMDAPQEPEASRINFERFRAAPSPREADWTCGSCVHAPPLCGAGKPCCVCDPDDPRFSCYEKREDY